MFHIWDRRGSSVPITPAVAAALERLCPADILALPPGRQRYTQFLNAEGGVIDDLMVSRPPGADGELNLVVNASRKEVDFALLEADLPASVRLTRLDQLALIALQGPAAVAVLQRLAPDSALAAMPFMAALPIRFGRIEAFASRSGYTGEDGFEISLPADQAEGFARRLLAEPEVAPIGLGARDSLRLEAGLCLYGHELDENTDPIEAGLSWSIQKRRRLEGGFPGAARIQKALTEGPARRRVGLRPDGRAPAREGAEIVDAAGARDRPRHLGRLRPQRRRADRDGLCRQRKRCVRRSAVAHRARQAARRARRAPAFPSPRLSPRLTFPVQRPGVTRR